MAKKSVMLEELPSPTNGTYAGGRPAEEDIAFRAYHIFVERGARHGLELDDWLQAERELIAAELVKTQPSLSTK